MAGREQQVLELIRREPMLPQQAIAARLGISRSAVAGHIMNLTNKGLIKGRGYVLSETPFVAVVGGANVDIHGRASNMLLAGDSNPGEVTIAAGGVARNIAENLVRLGIDCRLVSAIGSDLHGRMLKRYCDDAGIDTRNLHEIAAAVTSSYIAVFDAHGELQVAVNDMSVLEHLTPGRLEPQKAMLEQASVLVIDCNLPAQTLAWLTSAVKPGPVFADTVSTAKAPRLKPHLHAIHTLKASAMEVEALLDRKLRTQTELRSAATQLHAEGVQRVFITRGENGVFFSCGDEQDWFRPAAGKRDISSTGGAGDAFVAALAYAWLQDWDLQHSLRFALSASELTLSTRASNNPAMSVASVIHTMEQLYAS